MDLTQSLVELRDTLYTWVTRKLALSQGSRPRRIMKSFVSRTISLLLPTCFTGFVVRVCVLVYVLQLASVPEAMWKKHWRHFVAYSQGDGLQGFINQAMFVLTSSAVSMGDITKECVLSAAALTREELWRLFTSAVFHVNLIHLLSNMHAFSEIGTFVEKSYGTWRKPRYVMGVLIGSYKRGPFMGLLTSAVWVFHGSLRTDGCLGNLLDICTGTECDLDVPPTCSARRSRSLMAAALTVPTGICEGTNTQRRAATQAEGRVCCRWLSKQRA
eukprot:scaffold1115_cov390-Prasinococcus_capsulatus_cf.AAC.8